MKCGTDRLLILIREIGFLREAELMRLSYATHPHPAELAVLPHTSTSEIGGSLLFFFFGSDGQIGFERGLCPITAASTHDNSVRSRVTAALGANNVACGALWGWEGQHGEQRFMERCQNNRLLSCSELDMDPI